MPELPEVEVTRRAIAPKVLGKAIRRVENRDPKRYPGIEAAGGARVLDVLRRGKFLLFRLSDGRWLIFHLGMSGGFRFQETPHTRAVLELEDGALYFHDPRRFGRIWLVERPEEVPLLARIGPEPTDPAFNADHLYQKAKRSRRPIKAILMDQEVVAGLGNIYADEALFRAGVRPTRPGNRITKKEAGRIVQAVREVLEKALKAGGSTLKDQSYRRPDEKIGYFQLKHAVYGREDKPCPLCGAPVRRTRIQGRSAHYCPNCQR